MKLPSIFPADRRLKIAQNKFKILRKPLEFLHHPNSISVTSPIHHPLNEGYNWNNRHQLIKKGALLCQNGIMYLIKSNC